MQLDVLEESLADISYNIGAGARWDVNDNLFLKAMMNFMASRLDTHTQWIFALLTLDVGWRF